MSAPAAGRSFVHRRWLREVPGVPSREWPNEAGRITRVAGGVVYYGIGADARKAAYRMGEATFEAKCVKEWLS